MNRNEDVPLADFTFISFGFEFRNAQTDQTTGDPTHGGSNCDATQRGDNRTGCNERPDPWNGQSADSGDPTQCPADDTACAGSSDSAFRGLGVLFVSEVTGRPFIREKHRDIIV